MRKIKNSLCRMAIVIFFICSTYNYAQNKFAFHKNNYLYISSAEGDSFLLGSDIKIKLSKTIVTSKRYTYGTMPADVWNNIKITIGMVFYFALQSLDGNTWLFVERNMQNSSYNFCLYDNKNRNKEIIFSQDNGPDPNYAFTPIAWGNAKDVVYLEALKFGSAAENEGIWSYNIVTKQFAKLSISPFYSTTPVISPDGEYFIYGGTSDSHKDLHSAVNTVFVYDIKNELEKIVIKDNNSWFSISGWITNKLEKSDIINIDEGESTLKKNDYPSRYMQITFELPWNNGVSYYVSRAGTPAPSGSIGSNCFTNAYINLGYQPHSYIAIDFDSPNNVYDPVRASAAGRVIYAQFNSDGYGNLVKILHNDNTITYYAHLNKISVNVNDFIQQGCEIGDGGTTGNSSGDHIHFEWRDVGDVRMINTYPTFNECGCQPHPNYCYISHNVSRECIQINRSIPGQYSLSQNYPNPFNQTTTLLYGLPLESQVTMTVYNILGEEIENIINEVQSAGFHIVNWDSGLYVSGIYIYRINAKSTQGEESFRQAKKMILIK